MDSVHFYEFRWVRSGSGCLHVMGVSPSVTVVFKNVVGHDDIVGFLKVINVVKNDAGKIE